MAKKPFQMAPEQITKIVGTVASPLIVISELLKNAVDASASMINITYNDREKLIIVENDQLGFSLEEIENLSMPGTSLKKTGGRLSNSRGMFLTGSKGLGLLSVFTLCDQAEIFTVSTDQKIHKVILNKSGTVESDIINDLFDKPFTRVTLKNVSQKAIALLSSESEVKKLRHVCTYLYKNRKISFPKMRLKLPGQESFSDINFTCEFPLSLYDASFAFQKEITGQSRLSFRCFSPQRDIKEALIKSPM